MTKTVTFNLARGPDLPNFEITLEELKTLMTSRGKEGVRKINEMGGIFEICRKLRTSPSRGIQEIPAEMKQRTKTFGSNYVPPKPEKSLFKLVLEAFNDVIIIMLAIAATISLSLSFYKSASSNNNDDEDDSSHSNNGYLESVAILVSLCIVVLVSAGNNYTKERQFRSLQAKLDESQRYPVIRGGAAKEVPIKNIVVGDICQIKYGDLVPADGILIQSNDLVTDESSLTGESDGIKKDTNLDPMILAGTHVMEGSGRMIVVCVGVNTQAGRIYTLLSDDSSHSDISSMVSSSFDRNKSVLQMKLTRIAVFTGYIATTVAILIIVVLFARYSIKTYVVEQKPWDASHVNHFVEFFIIGVSVLVVSLPEGLPLAVTISLAYSVKKMMRDNNLVRHLDACETMGNATVICSDKTGTLTTNRMTVVQSHICEEDFGTNAQLSRIPESIRELVAEGIATNCSYTSVIVKPSNPKEKSVQLGNKTECALLDFVEALGENYQRIRNVNPEDKFIRVYTFNSTRKYMGTVLQHKTSKFRLHVKGAAEVILKKCIFLRGEEGDLDLLTKTKLDHLARNVVGPMTNNGLRTLALAYRDFYDATNDWEDEGNVVSKLVCLAIIGMEDPVRDEVPLAIQTCQNAGITVIMLTGDNINTARSIARKCGIISPQDGFLVLEGSDFNRRIRDQNGNFSQNLFDELLPKLRVLARSTPIDKYNLVKGIINSKLSEQREVVAVTGDGTNDAPALKIADVGFAMGIAGTDVAKTASDIIIMDDNFESIVKAVIWGRNVYDNVCKFLQFQLTVNFVAVIVAAVGAFYVSIPLTAVQMLWINLVMDTMASLALATEVPSPSLLRRKPYGRTKPIVSPAMWKNIVGQGVYQLVVVFTLLFFGPRFMDVKSGFESKKPTQHFTMIFNVFVMMSLFNEINSRKVKGERNVFEGIWRNPMFCCIWIGSFTGQVCIVHFGGAVFSTKKLTLEQWMWCVLLGVGVIIWAQLIITIPPRR